MAEKANILVVDDELGPRESLKMVLKPFYTIFTAENGEQALAVIKSQPIDLVTLDLKMAGSDGTEVLREIKKTKEDIEVIIITGFGSLRTAMEGIRYCAADYILKPFDIAELISIVNRTLDRKKLNDRLKMFTREMGKVINIEADLTDIKKMLREQVALKEKVKGVLERSLGDEALHPEQRQWVYAKGIAEILEGQASYTTCHSKRVAHYCHLIAQKLQLNPKELTDLRLGAYLHDIGSVGMDRKLFPKEGLVSQSGGEKIRRHTEIGSELVAPLGFSQEVTYIVRHHHEHYDGSGFPEGLKGKEIPLLARIVAVAEAFDEMINPGPDHEALSLKEAIVDLKKGSGNRFDPEVVETFVEIIQEKREALLPQFMESKAAA
jgi:putative nucleotidyltransferase with HDIG domain